MANMRDFMDRRKRREQASQILGDKPAEGTPPPPVLVYACGHKVGIKNLTDEVCPGCVNNRRRQKNASRTKKVRAGLEKDEANRLPNGSTFDVIYDSIQKKWCGTLNIFEPTISNQLRFQGSASGVFRLLRELDQQYRDWLEAQKQ